MRICRPILDRVVHISLSSVLAHMGDVFLIVACHIWLMAARDRHSLALTLKCHQCGREGIAYISENKNQRRSLRLTITNATEGFAVREHGRSFECVACNVQVRVK
jgi:hypothetical protein